MLADFLHEHLGNDAANLVIRMLIVVVILLVTWLIRQFVGAIMPRLVRRLHRWTRSNWDERIVDALLPPARFFVTVVGLWSATIALELPNRLYSSLATLINSLVALLLFWTIFRLVDPSVDIFWSVSRRTMRTTTGLPSLLDEKLGAVLKQLGHAFIGIGFAAVEDHEKLLCIGSVANGTDHAGFDQDQFHVSLALRDTSGWCRTCPFGAAPGGDGGGVATRLPPAARP